MNNDWITRKSLLLRAHDKEDQCAWGDFIHYYQPFIKMVLLKFNIPSADLDDLRQNILIKLWRNLEKYDINLGKAQFRTWLNSIIRNMVADYWSQHYSHKERIRKKIQHDDNLGRFSTADNDQTKLIEREWKAYVTSLTLKNISEFFSGKAIQVFKLSLNGETTLQIARKLNIKEKSVYMLRSRVKSRFMLELKQVRHYLEVHGL
jgi:RNA polymerase sigma factor (sigma-70 family)